MEYWVIKTTVVDCGDSFEVSAYCQGTLEQAFEIADVDRILHKGKISEVSIRRFSSKEAAVNHHTNAEVDFSDLIP